MKTADDFINSIKVIQGNFEHIAKTEVINGTLREDIRNALNGFLNDYKDELKKRVQSRLEESNLVNSDIGYSTLETAIINEAKVFTDMIDSI